MKIVLKNLTKVFPSRNKNARQDVLILYIIVCQPTYAPHE